MALIYIGGGLIVILLKISTLPKAIALIFHAAFSGQAAAGGFAGAAVAKGIQFGVARGIFSNEAGRVHLQGIPDALQGCEHAMRVDLPDL
jgi:AGCS family alanine or glycine:cation symporter